jgi:hypothetical protein
MAKNIPVYMITTQPQEASKILSTKSFAAIQVLKCDYTAIRSAARTNPCVYLLNKGTIVDKQSYKRMDKILHELESIAQQPAYAKSSADKPATPD